MACEQKRSIEEMRLPSKRPCLEMSYYTDNSETYVMNRPSLVFPDMLNLGDTFDNTLLCSDNDMSVSEISKSEITENSSSNMCDNASFPDTSCDETLSKSYLNSFLNDLDLDFSTTSPPDDQSLANISHSTDTLDNITSNNTNVNSNITHSSDTLCNISHVDANVKTSRRFLNCSVYHKELAHFMFLSLKLHNRQYYVHIREFKRDLLSKEEIPTKNAVVMDINSWYEFQYKIFAFNLKYKSSSFIANNTILVTNCNNSVMQIKNLKNRSYVDLNEYQLDKLKEMAYDLNKALIHHMYTKQLPYLIKRKCTVGKASVENDDVLMNTMISCLEDNVLTILNRIYECNGCILKQLNQSLHSCIKFNSREKFQQMGDIILILVDIEFIACTFSSIVNCISESFLCKMSVNSIRSVLFKLNKI